MKESECSLDRCFLCQHCHKEWKDLIALKKKTFLIKKGRKVFSEGDAVQGMYFVNEGAAKVSMHWGPQKELLIRFAKPGDVLGFRGIGGDAHYPVSATTLEDSKICFVDTAFLETSLTANATLAYQMMLLYASELQKAEKRLRDLAHREVKGRIALALLDIAETFGTGEDGSIPISVTRQDIASYAGTTYETVFKFFTEPNTAKLFSTSGKSIRIIDRKALESLVIKPHHPGQEPTIKKYNDV
jgi:CRP-like cAMP-binding protein